MDLIFTLGTGLIESDYDCHLYRHINSDEHTPTRNQSNEVRENEIRSICGVDDSHKLLST